MWAGQDQPGPSDCQLEVHLLLAHTASSRPGLSLSCPLPYLTLYLNSLLSGWEQERQCWSPLQLFLEFLAELQSPTLERVRHTVGL